MVIKTESVNTLFFGWSGDNAVKIITKFLGLAYVTNNLNKLEKKFHKHKTPYDDDENDSIIIKINKKLKEKNLELEFSFLGERSDDSNGKDCLEYYLCFLIDDDDSTDNFVATSGEDVGQGAFDIGQIKAFLKKYAEFKKNTVHTFPGPQIISLSVAQDKFYI